MSNKEQWTTKRVDKFNIVNQKLGEGSYGIVYRAFQADDESKQVAAKVIQISNLTNNQYQLDQIKREITLLQKINSKYIVRLYEVARTNSNLYLFFEYCKDGDLKNYLQKHNQKLSISETLLLTRHLVEGFRILHKLKIVHRDIKPANILLSNGYAKLADFGFAKDMENQSQAFISQVGSPLYMAPQMLGAKPYTEKCDIWGLGLVIYEMLYGKTPWTGQNPYHLLCNIQQQKLEFPQKTNIHPQEKKLQELLKKMLQEKEENRIGWQTIFDHELMKKPLGVESAILSNSTDINQQYFGQNLVAGYLKDASNDNSVDGQEYEEEKKIEYKHKNCTCKDYSHCKNCTKIKIDINQIQIDPFQQAQSPKMNQNQVNKPTIEQITQVVKSQIEEDTNHKIILELNQFHLFERNVAFFYNLVIQRLTNIFNQNKIKINYDLQISLIFCISKHQITILQETLKKCEDETLKPIASKEIWLTYINSEECKGSKNLINNDIKCCNTVFKDLEKKANDQVNQKLTSTKISVQQKDLYIQFKKFINNNFTRNQDFLKIYDIFLNQYIQIIQQEENINKDQDLLISYIFLLICQKPYKLFNDKNYDFNKFYEEIEHSSVDMLKQTLNSVKQQVSN